MKRIIFAITCLVLAGYAGISCHSQSNETSMQLKNAAGEYDPKRGVGKYSNVDISGKVNPATAAAGEKIYGIKCSGCHKVTDERLVGPGWKGVTERHQPEWIMNFLTNTEEMLQKDPAAQQQLETCLVRMPNQGLADKDARSLLEYMRKNDGAE